jgi:hypothetical protein
VIESRPRSPGWQVGKVADGTTATQGETKTLVLLNHFAPRPVNLIEDRGSTVNLATGLLLQQRPFSQTPMNHGYLPENTALGVLFPNSHDHNGFSPTSTAKQYSPPVAPSRLTQACQ